ncbi:hypothetical protein E0H32_15025 [Rhizobium leguminosarum bv. viciae]|nr:hypothetical protein E0H32_15025 [Rhizobium leguminosarum bv. viciae]
MVVAATLLTVGVVLLTGVAFVAGSSLANNVLRPGSKMQPCRIAPEPIMNVEHMSTRMMSLLFMEGAPGPPFQKRSYLGFRFTQVALAS